MEEGKLSKKDIKIVIAAHKPYRMPEDTMYVPLHVGAEGKKNPDGTPLDLGYQKDNEGDNISAKNEKVNIKYRKPIKWGLTNIGLRYIFNADR